MSILAANIGSGRPGYASGKPATFGYGRLIDDPDLARLVAIAEAAERYAGLDNLDDDSTVTTTLDQLDGAVIDIDRIPRCSEAELARPGCPVTPFDPAEPIRWTRGVDLLTREPTWVPSVMVRYGQLDLLPNERFWTRLSTGYAVHFDPVKALLGAVSEVVERDIIAILWRQRLPLPLVSPAVFSETSRYLCEIARRQFIEPYLFDATTDLGVPTVYSLQISEYDQRARQTVSCATGATMTEAVEKVLLESMTGRGVFYSETTLPDGFEHFHFLEGPRYMAVPERADAFDFLLADLAARPPAPERADLPEDPDAALRHLMATFAAKGMQVIAADRTTDELAAAGLCAVSIAVPDLQPMSLSPLAQYLGHPRLYDAPRAMGYRSLTEGQLNPWPQPFP